MATRRSYLEGAFAQGLPSLANFVAAMWLIWQTSLEQFGIYSFLFALSALITSIQRPLISLPMSVFAARRNVTDHYADFFTFHLCALFAGCTVALVLGWIVHAPVLVFTLYVVCQQLREFVKSYLFSVHDRAHAMLVECVANLVFLGCMSYFHVSSNLNVASVLLASAAGASVFLLPWIRARNHLNARRRRRFRWVRYLHIWRFAKWSVAGAFTNEVSTRSYNYIVALFGGFELLGLINFARQLYAPIQLLSNAWSQISLPVQREHYVSERHAAARRLRVRAQFGFVIVTALWTTALYLALPIMHQWKTELDSPVLPMLLMLWCIYYLIDSQLILYMVEFHLRREFRYLFRTGFVCAVAMLLLSIPVVLWLPETWLVAVATLLNAGLLVVYFKRLLLERSDGSFSRA